MIRKKFFGALIVVLFGGSACMPAGAVPVASSASEVGYAKTVPATMESRSSRYESDMESAHFTLDESIDFFVRALEDIDWELLLEIYEKAEGEGKSRSYFAHRAQAEAVLGFYVEEKNELVDGVTGAVNEKAEEKRRCKEDYHDIVESSLQMLVVQRLVGRRREASDAHQLLLRNEEKFGEEDTLLIGKQVDELMFLSYMAQVGAKSQRLELERVVAEGSGSRTALSERIAEIAAQEASTKEEHDERVELQDALDALDPALEKAKAQLTDAKKAESDLAQKYDKSWAWLLKEVKTKILESSGEAAEGQEEQDTRNDDGESDSEDSEG